jgi:hypothetical protein
MDEIRTTQTAFAVFNDPTANFADITNNNDVVDWSVNCDGGNGRYQVKEAFRDNSAEYIDPAFGRPRSDRVREDNGS